jgi:hypothetical protein
VTAFTITHMSKVMNIARMFEFMDDLIHEVINAQAWADNRYRTPVMHGTP